MHRLQIFGLNFRPDRPISIVLALRFLADGRTATTDEGTGVYRRGDPLLSLEEFEPLVKAAPEPALV